MSTTDPRVARAEREARAASSPAARIVTAIMAIVHLGLWVGVGYGAGGLFDAGRLMAINPVDAWDSPYETPLAALWPIPCLLVGSVLGIALTFRVTRFGMAAATMAPFVTGMLGAAIGLTLFIPSWTRPQHIGEKAPLGNGASEPWDFGSWLAYFLPYWLPALLAIAAFVLLFVAIGAAARLRAKAGRMLELAKTGTRVRGTVTEVIDTGLEIQDLPRVRFTVRFTDADGVERWVTKKSIFPVASVPREGDPAVVWFDPLNPGDEKGIMVGLGPEAAGASL
jgi:hypothetical protein